VCTRAACTRIVYTPVELEFCFAVSADEVTHPAKHLDMLSRHHRLAQPRKHLAQTAERHVLGQRVGVAHGNFVEVDLLHLFKGGLIVGRALVRLVLALQVVTALKGCVEPPHRPQRPAATPAVDLLLELVGLPRQAHEVDDVDAFGPVEALHDPFAEGQPHLAPRHASGDVSGARACDRVRCGRRVQVGGGRRPPCTCVRPTSGAACGPPPPPGRCPPPCTPCSRRQPRRFGRGVVPVGPVLAGGANNAKSIFFLFCLPTTQY